MKTIEVDDELYQYIASHTTVIGESASEILRRLLGLTPYHPSAEQGARQMAPAGAYGSVFDCLNKEELALQRGAVGRFLHILAALHKAHADEFDKVLSIRGRDRLYFARDRETLLCSGSSTKPKAIPDSDYWVITNSNTTRKKHMLTDVAKVLGYSDAEAEAIRDLL